MKWQYSMSEDIYAAYLNDFWENTHTCIEIDERENLKDIFIDTLSFLPRKIHRSKNQFHAEIYKWGMLTSFLCSKVTRDIFSLFESHSEYLSQLFNVIIRVLWSLLQWKIPVNSSAVYWKLTRGRFKGRIFSYYWMNIVCTQSYL